MLATGKYFENIVEMLTQFRSEVQTFASLGLLNINKHSENFMKTLLNLTYGYEVENLNTGKPNFPGLDLGDEGEGIAFQISSTKKAEKIEDTLATCLKYKHYETYKNINVFILTKKQTSYSIKTVTEPHFSFSAKDNIRDFDDLIKHIESLGQSRMQSIHDYLQRELQPTIVAIKNDKSDNARKLLDTDAVFVKTPMTTYCAWQSTIKCKSQDISVPEILQKLNEFLPSASQKSSFLPTLNPALIKKQSGKEILFMQEIMPSAVANWFSGIAMLLEPSTVTIEKANYTDNNIQTNLLSEMIMTLTLILFFSKYAKTSYEIEVSVSLNTNTEVSFEPRGSLVIERVFSAFKLESPFTHTETVTDIETTTLADLLQKIMHGFIAHERSLLNHSPFITIDKQATEFVINNIKSELGFPKSVSS